ncbi:MAG: NRDE family protein [Porticoccaceae bacterium]
MQGIIACRLVGYNNAMCLIVLAWQSHPDYPLILVANRDEYYRRPTADAQFWADDSRILGGRDLQAGGTWLGVRKDGRWAAVTNYREGATATAPRSRGELTSAFLKTEQPLTEYATSVMREGPRYGGFNLLLGEDDQLLYCSNRQPNPHHLQAGIHSLSNHLLDTPWPKAQHAREALAKQICAVEPDPVELLACLQRDEPYPDELLPNTGVGIELERLLSPPFIRSESYGTRCSTVLMKHRSGRIRFLEQGYQQGGTPGERREFVIEQGNQ